MPFQNEETLKFIESFHKALDEDLDDLRTENEADRIPLIMRETEAFLRLMLGIIKPDNILEIGTAEGYSSLFFAKLLPEAHITTIERDQHMAEKASANFSSFAEGSRIELKTGDAACVLKSLKDETASGTRPDLYDFVFIDAAKSHYREFFDLAEGLISDDAYIVCDNILLRGWITSERGKEERRHRTNVKYMRQFLDHISARDDLEVTVLSCGDGLAVIRHR